MRGVVRYFDEVTGNGIIVSDDLQKGWQFNFTNTIYVTKYTHGDRFLMYPPSLQKEISNTLKAGTEVTFELVEDSHYTALVNIRSVTHN